MGIFSEYGGRGSYYTADELDRLQNPEKYNYTQETYDAFSAQVQKKADSRAKAEEAAMDAIPYSYVGRGAGSTNPAFSFGGFSGHTSGLADFQRVVQPGHPLLKHHLVLVAVEGGAVPPVQYMQEGGMIKSPYADPMKPTMRAMPIARWTNY